MPSALGVVDGSVSNRRSVVVVCQDAFDGVNWFDTAGVRDSMDQSKSIDTLEANIPPYPQESLLVDAVAEMSGRRIVSTSPGLAQFAGAAAQALPLAVVSCTYLDAYRAKLAADYWHGKLPNLRIECATDLPDVEADAEADVVALPLSSTGEAELARELMQAGHQRLAMGGKIYAATNSRDDTWLERFHFTCGGIHSVESSFGIRIR